MTATEFLVVLREARDRFDWSLEPNTAHVNERRKTPRYCIRGTPRDSPSGRSLDPLVAVCYVLTGRILDSDTLAEVTEALDVAPDVAAVIKAAANDQTWTGPEGKRSPDDHIQFIRNALLEAVGLAVDTSV